MAVRSLRQAMSGLASGLDFYGHPVGVRYRGSGAYSTKLGALCSLITVVLVLINMVDIWKKFVNKTDQSEFFLRTKTDTLYIEPLVFGEQQVMFTLYSAEKRALPEKYGKWTFKQENRNAWAGETTDLGLVRCNDE